MKLSKLLEDDWVLTGVAAPDLTRIVDALLGRVRPSADAEERAAATASIISGAVGDVTRLDDDVVVVVGSMETLQGRGFRLGAALAARPFALPEPEEGSAQAVILVLTPGRPGAARHQLVPPLVRALKAHGGIGPALQAPEPRARELLRELLDVEFRPRLLVEDAVVPVQYRVYPSTPFAEVVDLMVRREVHAVPVIGERYEVLGIVTTGDALEDILHRGRPGDGEQGKRRPPDELTARDFMKRSVLCVSEDQPLVDAANMMVNRDVEQLPVVRDGELVGFVTRKSILRSLHRSLEPENDDNAETEHDS